MKRKFINKMKNLFTSRSILLNNYQDGMLGTNNNGEAKIDDQKESQEVHCLGFFFGFHD